MPIRFRCAYCNQLMGIARRKAGTVVRCPKCAGEIIVPMPEGAPEPEDMAEQAGAGGLAFDVEQLNLGGPEPGAVTAAARPEPALPPTEQTPAAPPGPAAPPPPRVGVFVPLGMLIVSIGVVVLLLILMLVLGLIIGRASALPDTKSAAHGLPSLTYATGVMDCTSPGVSEGLPDLICVPHARRAGGRKNRRLSPPA